MYHLKKKPLAWLLLWWSALVCQARLSAWQAGQVCIHIPGSVTDSFLRSQEGENLTLWLIFVFCIECESTEHLNLFYCRNELRLCFYWTFNQSACSLKLSMMVHSTSLWTSFLQLPKKRTSHHNEAERSRRGELTNSYKRLHDRLQQYLPTKNKVCIWIAWKIVCNGEKKLAIRGTNLDVTFF